MYVYHLHQYFSARDYKLKHEIMCLSETLSVFSQSKNTTTNLDGGFSCIDDITSLRLRDLYVIALL